MEKSKTNRIFWLETLQEEMKSFVLEKQELANRDESVSKTIRAFVAHQKYYAKNYDSSQCQNSTYFQKFPTTTLMREVKTEKDVSEL